jgi:phosphonate transport system permease protein
MAHRTDASEHRRLPKWPPLLSLILPGLGQMVQGQRSRGVGLLAAVLALGGLILWQKVPLLLVPLGAVWLWGVWDAVQSARNRPSGTVAPFLLGAFIVYALAVRATEINPGRLVSGWSTVRPIVRALVHPELLEYPKESHIGYLPFQVPCVEPLPPPQGQASAQPRLKTDVPCAALGETITLEGEGFLPGLEVEIWWQNPIGDYQRVLKDGVPLVVPADGEGRFRVTVQVPVNSVPLDRRPGPGETQTHRIEARQYRTYGSLQPTETLRLVLEKIGETIALAFIATVLATLFALPVSFLAARNLMGGHPVGLAVYYVVRTVLNIVRSIETLMWAIIFAVWVGLGPFDGTLALLLHSIAALGKLYSEAIEGIDPGPIEAVRATGANWTQTVVYAVLPQFLPSFLAFTLYRWDINLRMSTVIGLVSNAGLGFLIIQWIRLSRYNSMATAIIAIVLVVALLDYASAALRERIIAGGTGAPRRGVLRRYGVPVVAVAAFLALFVWSWRVAEINLPALIEGAPAGLRISRAFLFPDLLTRPTEEVHITAPLVVPCGAVPQPASPSSPEGPRVTLSIPCGSPGDPLVISGEGLPPNADVSVRWRLPDGGFLRVKENCCRTDAAGTLRLETRVHPLMEVQEGTAGEVEISWKRTVGGYRPSEALVTTVNLSLVTLLMALMATTLGSVVAVPLSFLGASNVMGRGPVGRAAYFAARTVFNLWRSVEPMILAVICASWVGLGPFAGVLALALNNIPNLAKLFSEAIEEIDPGPVEAVTATGANPLQVLVYAVLPQLVPRFLAYILYQWDINIRMSTVIGFVGGGGIGQQFRVWVGLNQYAAAGTATWAIVAMVWGMDYVSAKARARLI